MDCSQEFLDFVKNSSFDYKSLRRWECETLRHYLGLGNDMKLMQEIEKLTQEYLKSDDFRTMCDLVRTFCETHNEKFIACYCNIERGAIGFFLVSKEEKWNPDTSDIITELGIQLDQQHPEEYTEIRLIPHWGGWICNQHQFTHVWGKHLVGE